MNFKVTCIALLYTLLCLSVYAQQPAASHPADAVVNQTDFYDIIAQILKRQRSPVEDVKKLQVALIPSVGYNPSTGADFALSLSAAKYTGDPSTTKLSTAGISAYAATKGLISVEVKHSIFCPAINGTCRATGK